MSTFPFVSHSSKMPSRKTGHCVRRKEIHGLYVNTSKPAEHALGTSWLALCHGEGSQHYKPWYFWPGNLGALQMSSPYVFIQAWRMTSCKSACRENLLILPPTSRKTHCHWGAAGRATQHETRMPCFSSSPAPSASVHFLANQSPRHFIELIKKTQTHKQAWIVRVAGLREPASLLTPRGTISAFISFFAKAAFAKGHPGSRGNDSTVWKMRGKERRVRGGVWATLPSISQGKQLTDPWA